MRGLAGTFRAPGGRETRSLPPAAAGPGVLTELARAWSLTRHRAGVLTELTGGNWSARLGGDLRGGWCSWVESPTALQRDTSACGRPWPDSWLVEKDTLIPVWSARPGAENRNVLRGDSDGFCEHR